jgi:hypothetical protein
VVALNLHFPGSISSLLHNLLKLKFAQLFEIIYAVMNCMVGQHKCSGSHKIFIFAFRIIQIRFIS